MFDDFMILPSAEDFLETVNPKEATRDNPPLVRGKVSASYTSGPVPVAFGADLAASSKGYYVLTPYTGPPAANDNVALAKMGNSYVIVGKIVNPLAPPAPPTDWHGIKWVEPGNATTFLSLGSAFTNFTSYARLFRFALGRPGRYRIKGAYHNSDGTGGAVFIQVVMHYLGAISPIVVAGPISTTSFDPVNYSLDMNITGPPGMVLEIQGKINTSGTLTLTSATAVTGQDATSTPTPANFIIT
jgi:hypothetical protein